MSQKPTAEWQQKRERLRQLNRWLAFDIETNIDLAKASQVGLKRVSAEFRRYDDLHQYLRKLQVIQRKNKTKWTAQAEQLRKELWGK